MHQHDKDQTALSIPSFGFDVKASTTSQWTEHIDEESGRAYYYNKEAGETTWTKPDGFGSPLQEDVTLTVDNPLATTRKDESREMEIEMMGAKEFRGKRYVFVHSLSPMFCLLPPISDVPAQH